MAHFYIYGDESGKLEQSQITSFCGYVGHATEFERVMMEWNNCRFTWGIPPIHTRLIMDPGRDKSGEWGRIRTDWGNLWEDKRDEMLNDFSLILLRSHLAATGAVVDAEHFRFMPTSPWKAAMKNPIYISLYTLLMESLDKIDRISTSLPVSIVIDDDPQTAIGCYGLLTELRKQFPRVRERLTAVTFGDDKQYPALQMADMIAYHSRSFMVERITKKDAVPSLVYTAITKRGIHQPKFWSAEALDLAATLP